MIKELNLINKFVSNPFLEDVEIAKMFEEVSKDVNIKDDSLKLRKRISNKTKFADVQADGMH
tara:strand:- start:160 stop:345 length:186 start_codon:yes stop_codon:yes gene_type:complete